MKLWSIDFNGLYPVGSAAIVATSNKADEDEACNLFRREWNKKYPNSSPEPVKASVLDDFEPGDVLILNDGNY